MRVAIMQPYFMPYIGYFSLIKHVDRFIILDDVQFIRHGWIERNRIKKPSDGWQYISVPLMKHSQKTLIKDIRINNTIEWQNKILAQLVHYKKAPYYKEVISLLEIIFQKDYDSITDLNLYTLQTVAEYLQIRTPIVLFSEMGLEIDPAMEADEWALNICRAMNDVTEYWNPPGGQDFFEREKYKKADIKLYFQKVDITPYRQFGRDFEGGLSILDVMMFNSKSQIDTMLDKYNLL